MGLINPKYTLKVGRSKTHRSSGTGQQIKIYQRKSDGKEDEREKNWDRPQERERELEKNRNIVDRKCETDRKRVRRGSEKHKTHSTISRVWSSKSNTYSAISAYNQNTFERNVGPFF